MTEHLILWLDLETTGGTEQDVPIEVGAALTDWNFNLIGMPFESVIALPDDFNMGYVVDAVREMHEKNGLWRDIAVEYNRHMSNGIRLEDSPIYKTNVDDALWSWISTTTNNYDMQTQGKELETLQVRLAGSGVSHFDSRFVKKHLPFTWGQLVGFDNDTKPTLDLGVIRRFLQTIGANELVAPNEFDTLPEITAHRALDDVILFIEQAKWYRRKFLSYNGILLDESIDELLKPDPWGQAGGEEPKD